MSTARPARRGRAPAPLPRIPQEHAGKIPLLHREPVDLLVLALLVILGLTLNHSSVIVGLNLSLADPVVAALILGLALSRRLWIPAGPLVFFLLLSVQLLAVTVLLVPSWTTIPTPASDTILDFTKLAVSFLCLVMGVQVVRTGHARLVLRAFVVGSVMVSGIAVVAQVVPLPGTGSLFYGGFRYQGLTNDPNNFAVMTVAALAVLWYDRGIRLHLSIIASAVLISGVLLSASKTGAITLVLLVVWRALGIRSPLGADAESLSRRLLAAFTVLGIAVLVLLVAPSTGTGGMLAEFTSHVPALDRLSTLLVSFDTAIAGNGSERSAAWITAITLILTSPLLGIGLGTYLSVAVELTGHEVLAHNTYLQIMAEWGLPFALVLLVWAARATLWRPLGTRHLALWATSSTTFLVLLVGSVGLSLNNSRLFWFILGITVATHMFSRSEQPTGARSGPSRDPSAPHDPSAPPVPSAPHDPDSPPAPSAPHAPGSLPGPHALHALHSRDATRDPDAPHDPGAPHAPDLMPFPRVGGSW